MSDPERQQIAKEVAVLARQAKHMQAEVIALDKKIRMLQTLCRPEWAMVDGLLLGRESGKYYKAVQEFQKQLGRLNASAEESLERSRNVLTTSAERKIAFKDLFDLLFKTEGKLVKLVTTAQSYNKAASKRLAEKTYSTEADPTQSVIAAIKIANNAGKILVAVLAKAKGSNRRIRS
jgi:hypothetical protein